MKKLKVTLAVLFAMVFAAALGACKNGDDPNGPGETQEITRINESRQTVLKLTDSETEDALNTKLANYDVNVVYKGSTSNQKIKGSECTFALKENVSFGTVGTYYMVVTPNENNPNNVHARVQVDIEHDFGSADAQGVKTCSHCHATYSENTLSAAQTLKFNAFHDGDNTLGAGNIIKPFGAVTIARTGRQVNVPSYTVGRLTKGASITVTGRAKADRITMAYYFPIIGIADASAGAYTEGGSYQGTSVFVRNEGWTLLNGVGSPRMLAYLAGGTNANDNYGSLTTDTGEEIESRPSGYDDWKSNYGENNYPNLKSGVPVKASEYKDWYVYTEGTIKRTSDYYSTAEGYTGLSLAMTWTYRNDGVMELTIANPEEETKLVARMKVPDNEQGYYDTLIHGDYMTYSITSASYITPKTLTGITAQADKDAEYLANTKLDYNDITVNATYLQTGDTAERATGFEVYGFVPSDDGADEIVTTPAQGETPAVTAKGTLYDLSAYSLTKQMTYFKVVLTVGPNSQEALIPAVDFVKITENAVNEVVAYPVTVSIATDDGTVEQTLAQTPINSYALSVKNGKANVAIDGVAGTMGGEGKYIAFRMYANELGTQFKPNVTGGGTSDSNVWYKTNASGSYVDVVLAVAKDATYEIPANAIQSTAIVFDITKVQGIAALSTVTAQNIYLNKAGTITVNYTFDAGTLTDVPFITGSTPQSNSLAIMAEKNQESSGLKITSVKVGGVEAINTTNWAQATTLEIVFEVQATALANVNSFGQYVLNLESDSILAQDTIKIEKTFADTGVAGQVLGDNETYAEVAGNTLYVARILTADEDITSGDLSFANFVLNFNAGTTQSVKLINLSGSYIDYEDAIILVDKTLTANGTVSVKHIVDGTVDNNKDVDYAAIAIYAIDLTKISSDAVRYFDIVGVSTEKCSYYKLEGNTITEISYKETVNNYKDEIISEDSGSCFDGALVAKIITGDNNFKFYAGAHYVGGEHKDTDGDHKCDLCGAAMGEDTFNDVWIWYGHQYNSDLAAGEFIDVSGVYETAGSELNDLMAVLLEEKVGSKTNLISMNGSGYGEYCDGGWDNRYQPYLAGEDGTVLSGDAEHTNFRNSLITKDNTYNTINGKLDGNGKAIDKDTLHEAMIGGTFRYTLTHNGEQIVVRMRLFPETWKNGDAPYFDYHFTIDVPAGASYYARVMGSDASDKAPTLKLKDGKLTAVKGKLVGSILEGGSTDGFEIDGIGEVSSPNLAYGRPVISEGMVNLAVSGMATKVASPAAGSNTHYAAITLNFSQALVDSTKASIDVAGGKVAVDGETMWVYIPLTVGTPVNTATISLSNIEGSTAQVDIKLDLSAVIVSDLEVSSQNNLSLAGGTFAITVSGGEVATTDQLVVNGCDPVAIQDVVVDTTKFVTENGTLTVTGLTQGTNTATITFTLTALDFTKALVNYDVKLTNAQGTVRAAASADPAVLPTAADVTVTDNDVYVSANGNKLTLLVVKDIGDAEDKALLLNANKGVASANLRLWNLGFKVDTNGNKASFVDSNLLVSGAQLVYTNLGSHRVAAITLDLSVLDIAAADAYGIEVKVGNATGLYKVSGTVVEALDAAQGTDMTQVAATCTHGAIDGKEISLGGTNKFYYGVTMGNVADHTWGTGDHDHTCTVCSAIKVDSVTGVNDKDERVYTTIAKEQLANVAKNGLTVSYALSAIPAGDWATSAVKIHGHAFEATSANLRANTLDTKDLGDLKAKADALKKAGDGGNIYPAYMDGSWGSAYTADNTMNDSETGFNPWASTVRFYNKLEYDLQDSEGKIKINYVAISISKTDGVQYYFNDILVLNYKGTYALQFAELFLEMAQVYGIDLAALGIEAKAGIVQPYAVTEDMLAAQFDIYKNEATKHVHVWDPDTDRCTDPNCPVDGGAIKPGHEHVDANNDGDCDKCGETYRAVPVAAGDYKVPDMDITGFTGLEPKWFMSLAYGQKITVTGDATVKLTEGFSNWLTPNAYLANAAYEVPFANAWYFRLDRWLADNVGTHTNVSQDNDGGTMDHWTFTKKAVSSINVAGDPFADFSTIVHGSNGKIEYSFDYTKLGEITVIMKWSSTVESATQSFTCTYVLKSDTMENLYTIGIGGEQGTIKNATAKVEGEAQVHTHSFSTTTDRCECGLLNPNHGDTTKGGLAHNWSATDHCTLCNILNPNHGDTTKGGLAHKWDATDHCEICGIENPVHMHSYSASGACACGYTCPHVSVTSGTCDECHNAVTASTLTVDSTNYWGDAVNAPKKVTVSDGDIVTLTAQYSDFNSKEWAGAILVLDAQDGTRKMINRYIDGWFPGDGNAIGATTGGDMVHNTHDNATLPNSRIKIVISYKDGAMQITVTKHAANDTKYENVIATRTITIASGLTGDMQFGIANADGSAFVDNTVKVGVISPAGGTVD